MRVTGLRSASFRLTWVIIVCLAGCARRLPEPESLPRPLAPINYTIQAGAFAIQDNAIRFTERLREHGMDAYYFIAEDTLFKVRFGDFTTRSDAEQTARNLVNEGTIDAFYIVQPELRSSADIPEKTKDLRRHLVHTAMRFIGCPYRYGGVSENGFDCSGLTMTIYRLNGLNLPRVSLDQYRLGRRVSLAQLQPGDLVFFRTTGNDAITHVGIYTGKGNFIHAPGKGKFVRTASLSEPYFEERYAGARNCLD